MAPMASSRAWIRRYLPMEVAGTVAAVATALVVSRLGGGPGHTALAASIAETLGFYAVAAVVVARAHRIRRMRRTARDLAVEFGPAEVLDTMLLRPALMYLGVRLLGDVTAGVLVGKLLADMAFYLVAVAGHRAGRRWFPPAGQESR